MYREYQAVAHVLRGALRADASKAALADDDYRQAQANAQGARRNRSRTAR